MVELIIIIGIKEREWQKEKSVFFIDKPSQFLPPFIYKEIKIREKIKELEMEKDAAAKDENYIVAEALKNQIEKLKGEL